MSSSGVGVGGVREDKHLGVRSHQILCRFATHTVWKLPRGNGSLGLELVENFQAERTFSLELQCLQGEIFHLGCQGLETPME